MFTSKACPLLLILLIVVSLTGIPSMASSDEPYMKLHFIPFRLETYLPVTKERLEERPPIVFLQPHKFIDELLSLLQAHPMNDHAEPNWQSSHLRLKADFGQRGTFFVGKAGTV